MSRVVYDLKWARMLNSKPDCIPQNRPRGQKALGKRYETAVARQLGGRAIQSQWWEFQDFNGFGFCQTDFLIQGKTWNIVLECKHTWTDEGMEQLQFLYLPVVKSALGRPTIGVQVCKNLVPMAVGPVFNSLSEAVADAKKGGIVTLHWHGFGSIL